MIPASWEAEARESLESGRRRLQSAKLVPLHSSLGDRVRLRLKKKKKQKLHLYNYLVLFQSQIEAELNKHWRRLLEGLSYYKPPRYGSSGCQVKVILLRKLTWIKPSFYVL